MTSLKQFKIRLKTVYDRYYPERQIFLRSDGRVRFLTLSPAFQASVSAVIVTSVLWGVYATIGYITNNYLVASHKAEISTLQDRQSALGDGYRLLENDLAVRTALLEKRQKFLETVIGNAQQDHSADGTASKSAAGSLPALDAQNDDGSIEDEIFNDPEEAVADDAAPDHSVDGSTQDGASVTTTNIQTDTDTTLGALVANSLTSADAAALDKQELRDRRHDIKTMLSELEARQSRTALQILEAKRAKLAAIDHALAETQFTSQDLAQLTPVNGEAGQGGPFLPLDGYTDFLESPIFEADDYVPFAQLNEAWSTLEMALSALESIPTGHPAKKYYLSSKFGRRKDPIKRNVWANHPGVDLAGWPGTDILASAPGRVVRARWYGAYGNMVEIDHGNGFKTRYGHMRKLAVKEGDVITKGETIGYMGKTGRVTDTHLHFEVWYKGKLHDPLPFLEAAHAVQDIIRTDDYAQTNDYTDR